MIAGLLALILIFAKLFPNTPFGRGLHLYFVELPLKLAHQIERRHLILLVILLCSGQMLALMGSAELALAYAVDMSIYYDAAVATSLAAAATFFRNAWASFTSAVARLVRPLATARSRARKKRPAAAPRKSASNDDDPAWEFALAA